MNLHFTQEEKKEILEHNGYEIKSESVVCHRSIYHNDTEEYVQTMDLVYFKGELAPGSYVTLRSVGPEHHLNEIFDNLFKEKIKEILITK